MLTRPCVLSLAHPDPSVGSNALHTCLRAPHESLTQHANILLKILEEEMAHYIPPSARVAAAALLLLEESEPFGRCKAREMWLTCTVEPGSLMEPDAWDRELLLSACAATKAHNLDMRTAWAVRPFFEALSQRSADREVRAAATDLLQQYYVPAGDFGLTARNRAAGGQSPHSRVAQDDDAVYAIHRSSTLGP